MRVQLITLTLFLYTVKSVEHDENIATEAEKDLYDFPRALGDNIMSAKSLMSGQMPELVPSPLDETKTTDTYSTSSQMSVPATLPTVVKSDWIFRKSVKKMKGLETGWTEARTKKRENALNKKYDKYFAELEQFACEENLASYFSHKNTAMSVVEICKKLEYLINKCSNDYIYHRYYKKKNIALYEDKCAK